MNEQAIGAKSKPVSGNSPYKDLYIYYLKGHITQENSHLGDQFIGNWIEDEYSFLFFSAPSKTVIDRLLKMQPDLILLDTYNMPYEEWLGETFSSLTIGSFFVSPPWQKASPAPDKLHIILDPGVVFGTGIHPTTRDCLEALELAYDMKQFNSVIDLGTGTGLLAVAAAKLGCKRVIAVDNNGLAVQTARDNIRLNGINARVAAVQGKAEECPVNSIDLILANIHYDVMKHLIKSDLFRSQIHFILSGLLRSQAKALSDMLITKRAHIIKKWDANGVWHTFFGRLF